MATYNKFTPAVENLLEGINSGTDSWSICLATAVNQAAGTFTEVANGNGYTTGGNSAAVSSATQSGGVYKLVLSNPATWTASGAGFSFQYVVLKNATTGTAVGYWDYGTSVSMNGTNGDTFTANLDGTNGVFQVS